MENTQTIDKRHFYCLILAGGKGRRLWPVSRYSMPKQFLDFFGTGKTMLQETYERFRRFLPAENIYVSTYKEYQDIVAEQLPHLDRDHLLIEPIRRNTAPIVAWAAHRIEKTDSEASIIISPADQIVMNEEAFQKDTLEAMAHAKADKCFLTMGIRPTRPEPGYGYIQMGDVVENANGEEGFYKVQSFTEKPERDFAEMFMRSGEFLWNTGLYIATPQTIRDRLSGELPSVMRSFDEEHAETTPEEERAWITERYATYPNLSIENGILERVDDVCVKECHFGWADVGTWHGVYEACSKSDGDNVTLDTEAQLSDTTGCLIKLPHGRTAVINGLHDFIVVEEGDVLLITPRTDTSDEMVKQLTRFIIDRDANH